VKNESIRYPRSFCALRLFQSTLFLMRLSTFFIALDLLVVQADLWFGMGSVPHVMSLRAQRQEQTAKNVARLTLFGLFNRRHRTGAWPATRPPSPGPS
jgi:hypothetical protein